MSTPSILPFLHEADRRRPELKTINTALSCFELLQLTLALAGPEWMFVGKTANMDGASVTPAGFSPINMTLTRPDGQMQTVLIVGVSMDAAWHVPSHQQIKVIANSSANDDPNPAIHGGARLTPYPIDPVHYRWHNPPIPQFGPRPEPWTPEAPKPAPRVDFPGREEMMQAGEWLDAFYRSSEGLQRSLTKNGGPDWEGIGAWLFDVFFMARVAGKTNEQAKAAVVAEIQRTDEWRSKHR